jgi:PAS domain S-box-containing protein
MPITWKLGLRGKLMVITTLVSALVLILSCLLFAIHDVVSFRRSIEQSTETTARMLGSHCTRSIQENDQKSATAILAVLATEGNIISGALYRADGTPFATYKRPAGSCDCSDIPRAPYEGQHFGSTHFELCQSIVSDGDLIGAVYLCVDLAWHRTQVLQYVGLASGMFVILMFFSAGLSFWAQRIITKPIARTTNVAKSIVAGELDYSARVPGGENTDELGTLVRSFNTMLAHIGESDATLQSARDELEQRVEHRTRELIDEIKHRRETEAALRMARDKAQKYLDMAGVMIVALDVEGRITLFNRKGTEITGYQEEELLGCDWFEKMLPEKGSKALRETFLRSLTEPESVPEYLENSILTASGESRLIAWRNTCLISADGDAVGFLSSGLDITELHRAEGEQRRAQKLESIGTFAGGIAHDFNNFLMIIHGNIELAQMSPDCPPDVQTLLDDAVAAASRARGLTRQLITFSKGGQPNKRTVKLAGLVRDTVAFVLTGSNVTPLIEVVDELWLTRIDAGQIEQVLTNLVVNAKQAMPGGGQIRISLANVDADTALARGLDPLKYVELTIHDDGAGIPADIISDVFDPYFTTKKEGTGLGLATSFSIVSKHEGHIFAESELRQGATFRVLLPAMVEEIPVEESKADASKLSRPYRILLMDDDPMVSTVIKIMLERLNCRASVANEGKEALQMYARALASDAPFDATILDLIVPAGMGGQEAAEKLLELDPYAKLIISSAYSNDPLMSEHAAHGFRGCLAKPYDQHDLEHVLKAVLEGDEEKTDVEGAC